MKRKTEMILKGIKIISNVGKAYAVGRTIYSVVKIGMQVRKGAKVASDVKEKGSKMLNIVKGIGTATEVAATATQVVSEISSDAKNLKNTVAKKVASKPKTKTTEKINTNKKRNR